MEDENVDKMKLEIRCGNAAFAGDDCGAELARILRKLADRIEGQSADSLANDPGVNLFDINGNKVGTVDFLT